MLGEGYMQPMAPDDGGYHNLEQIISREESDNYHFHILTSLQLHSPSN